MVKGSQSQRAGEDVARAARPVREGLVFVSVRHALRWYYERCPTMQAPLSPAPRTELAADGSRVRVDVDGGRGGALDEVLVTLSVIGGALRELQLSQPVQAELLAQYVRDGQSMAELAKVSQRSQSTVSAELGKAEAFLLGWLRRAEVVVAP